MYVHLQLVAKSQYLLTYQMSSLAMPLLAAMGMLCLEAPGRETAALALAMASPSQSQVFAATATVSFKVTCTTLFSKLGWDEFKADRVEAAGSGWSLVYITAICP